MIQQERRRDGGPSDRDVPELSPKNSSHVKNPDRRSYPRGSPRPAEMPTSPQRRPTRDERHGVTRGRRRVLSFQLEAPSFLALEGRLVLEGVNDDLGDKFIWQQLHQAHYGHQEEGEEIEKRRGLEIQRRRVEVEGDEG
jgi:hypothetical protein